MSIGYLETVSTAAAWIDTCGVTFPVLADQDGSVTLQYDNFVGFSILPWDAIVTVDSVVAHTENFFILDDVVAVLDSLFAPEITANPGQLDFGQVEVGQSADLDIVVDNAGTGLLSIDAIGFSSPVFSTMATFPVPIYAVDDSATFTINFAPDAGGTYNETMTIYSQDDTLEVPVTGEGQGVGVKPDVNLPDEFGISCFPNPFNAELTILVNLQVPQDVTITLYDVQGSKQADIWSGALSPGAHELRWVGQDAPSGIYLLNVAGDNWSRVEKVVLVR